jgi:hypothetical protein
MRVNLMSFLLAVFPGFMVGQQEPVNRRREFTRAVADEPDASLRTRSR